RLSVADRDGMVGLGIVARRGGLRAGQPTDEPASPETDAPPTPAEPLMAQGPRPRAPRVVTPLGAPAGTAQLLQWLCPLHEWCQGTFLLRDRVEAGTPASRRSEDS